MFSLSYGACGNWRIAFGNLLGRNRGLDGCRIRERFSKLAVFAQAGPENNLFGIQINFVYRPPESVFELRYSELRLVLLVNSSL